MNPYFYSDTISNFITASTNEIFGLITCNSDFPDEQTGKEAWKQEIRILKNVLENKEGRIFFEYSIPRMGTWNEFRDPDYKENYCHFCGEPSNGETSYAKPILKKNWNRAKQVHKSLSFDKRKVVR